MKYSIQIVFCFSIVLSSTALADPVSCYEYTEISTKRKFEECSFNNMNGFDQMSSYIPERYKGKAINRSTACGPTALASIYRHMYWNRDYYQPKKDSFFSQVVDKDVEQVLIPELYQKMETRYNYGTLPSMFYNKGLTGQYFDSNLTEYYSFFESSVFNTGTSKYFEWVKKRNPMAVVLGYITPMCGSALGVTKCSLIIPDTLHYEAVAGAKKTMKDNGFFGTFSSYQINLWDGNNTWQPETTDLVQVTEGCKRSSIYDVCTKPGVFFSWKKGFYFCDQWQKKEICELSYLFPIGMSKGMRFTSDNTNVENTKALWTFVLGYFGLNKK